MAGSRESEHHGTVPALPGLPVPGRIIPLQCELHDSRKAGQPCERHSRGKGDVDFPEVLIEPRIKMPSCPG